MSSASDQLETSRSINSAAALMVVGFIILIVSIVLVFVAKGSADAAAANASSSAGFASVLGGGSLADASLAEAAVQPDYTWMWVAVVAAVVGLILALAGIIIQLARKPAA